jgi:hypothetical protein
MEVASPRMAQLGKRSWTDIRGSGIWLVPSPYALIFSLTSVPKQWKNIFEEQLPGSPYQAFKDAFMDTMPKFSLPMGEACSKKWTVWLTEDALWSRFNTLSQVAMLKGQERAVVERTFKEALRGDDVQRNENGQIAVHGVTYYSWTDCL